MAAEHHSYINGFELKVTEKGGYIVKDADGTPIHYTLNYTNAVLYCKEHTPVKIY